MAIVIYARKSSESDDRQVQSLDDQIRVLKEFAKRENLHLKEVIQESRSAKLPGNRPEFTRLIRMVEDGKVDGILTWSVNRLSRNLVDGGTVAHLLQTGKLQFVRTPERIYRPEDNVLIMAVENGMATSYVQDLSRNVKRGMQGKCERGWYPGPAPMGYRNNPLTKEIEPDPVMFSIMRKGWEMILSRGYNVSDAHKEMVAHGLSAWRKGRFGPPVSKAAMFKAFDNPFYAGQIRYNGSIFKGNHIPMVSESEFAQAQAAMGKPLATQPKTQSFYFSGTIKCGKCGCAVIGTRKTKSYKMSGNTVEYVYYHCSGYKGCPKISMSEEELWNAVERAYNLLAIDDDFIEFARDCFERSLVRELALMQASELQMEATKKSLESKRIRVRKAFIDGDLLPEQFRECMSDLDASLKSLELNESEIRNRELTVWDAVQTVLDSAKALRNLDELTIQGVKGNFRCVGENHTLTLGKLKIDVHPVLRLFTTLEPPVRCSESGKLGVSKPQFQLWCRAVDEARKIAREQRTS